MAYCYWHYGADGSGKLLPELVGTPTAGNQPRGASQAYLCRFAGRDWWPEIAISTPQRESYCHTVSMIRLSALLLCAVAAWGQRPSDAEAAALIERSRQKALEYATSLPDFICSEVIRRSVASAGGISWVLRDILTVKLGYSQQSEMHKLELINGKPTDRKFGELEGATSSGEFGGVLRNIFDPASQAAFDWDSWKTVRKRHASVYQYAVSAANSRYYLSHARPLCACPNDGLRGSERKGIVGLHGTVSVDRETGEVLALSYAAYDIPKQLEIDSFVSTVEYDFAGVGGRNYLLPARSENEMRSPELWTRNKMEFRDYRKFSSDSVIDFGAVK